LPRKSKSASSVAEPPTPAEKNPGAPTAPADVGPAVSAGQSAQSADTRGRVFLIDAMSFIFRAYHAMARQRPMSTRTGIPTAATYVFVNMLNKLRNDFHPEYIAAVFDVAGPTFRDTQAATVTAVRKFDIKTQEFKEVEYKGYKANRAEMPPDLAQQVPYIRRALSGFRIPILENPGYEADDVIGTLARLAAGQSHPVFVVSSDKDMLQLVTDKICVLNPPKDNLICDRAKVEEILGVPPERVIDVMALRGDTIDNIPGAPGIGDKGSVDLIQRFGSVEGALDHAAEVEKKTYRESLQNNRDIILWSKQLATIDQHVPGVELNLPSMAAAEPDVANLRPLLQELEFTTLLQQLGPAPAAEQIATNYIEATPPLNEEHAAALERLLARTGGKNPLAFAIETDAGTEGDNVGPGVSPGRVSEGGSEPAEEAEPAAPTTGTLDFGGTNVGPAVSAGQAAAGGRSAEGVTQKIALSTAPGEAIVVDLSAQLSDYSIPQLLNSPIPKATHDLKSALRAGLELRSVKHDTLLYSYLLDPTYSSHALAAVALRRFNLTLSGSLAERADLTFRLAKSLAAEVDAQNLRGVYEEIDLPLVPVLARIESAGVKIDCGVLAKMSERLDRECKAKAEQIYERSGHRFNISSPRQLGDVLFNKLGLPKPIKYGKGKTISTAADVLNDLAEEHAVPKMVLEYRELTKLKSTYVDALPLLLNQCTQRLHTTFNQAGTATGRLSSNNPNLQNIPIRTELGREIRAAFIAEPGNLLLSADYSQIELRLLAHFSQDPLLLEAFLNDRDLHRATAAEVFGIAPELITPEVRNRAKAINFGIPYGLSGFGLAQQLGIEKSEAQSYIDAYFSKYAGVHRWLEATKQQARREQKVHTLFGRVRPIPDINSKNFNARGFAERTAVNTPLQGTAADLIKLAMIRIDEELRRRGLRSRMTLQVHDELVFEVPESEADTMRELVRERMENVHPLTVPLKVELGLGPNWRDLE
jgi:DNA polymerase-1